LREESAKRSEPDFQINEPNEALTDPEPPPAQIEQDPADHVGNSSEKYRVIDWTRSFFISVNFIVLMCLLPVLATETFKSPALALAGGLVALAGFGIAATNHFRGTVLLPDKDQLSFPSFIIFRRSVPISEIRDANCEFSRSKFDARHFIELMLGYDLRKLGATGGTYAVNVSGDFGGRQLKFFSRKRRDHFLSILRNVAPGCRITRMGFGGY
jgi:hypothetical protein